MKVQLSAPALVQIAEGFKRAPAHTQGVLLGTMTEATALLQREASEAMPRGATGITAGSLTSDAWSVPAGVLGVVGSSQPAALFVELGTKPHMPPVAALVPWVRNVLGVDAKRAPGVAYLVARKIARRGTPAQRPLGRTFDRLQGTVLRLFESAAARIATLPGAHP